MYTSQALCLSVEDFCEAFKLPHIVHLASATPFACSWQMTEDVKAGCEMLRYESFDDGDAENFANLVEMIVDSAGDLSENWMSDIDPCGFRFLQWITKHLFGLGCVQVRSFGRSVGKFEASTTFFEFDYCKVFTQSLTEEGEQIRDFLGKANLHATIWTDDPH